MRALHMPASFCPWLWRLTLQALLWLLWLLLLSLLLLLLLLLQQMWRASSLYARFTSHWRQASSWTIR